MYIHKMNINLIIEKMSSSHTHLVATHRGLPTLLARSPDVQTDICIVARAQRRAKLCIHTAFSFTRVISDMQYFNVMTRF